MLTILLKSSEMVEWKVRNNSWKFQVWEKSGTHFFGAVSKLSFLSPNSKKIFKVFKWLNSRKLMAFSDFYFFPTQWVTRLPHLVIFWRILKMKSSSIFSTLAGWICLILHILIVLIVLHHLAISNYLTWGQNYAKWGKFAGKKVKILILDYFSSLCAWMCLISQIMIALMVQDSYATTNGLVIEHPWRLKYLTFLLTHCTPFHLSALISEVHINRCLLFWKLTIIILQWGYQI